MEALLERPPTARDRRKPPRDALEGQKSLWVTYLTTRSDEGRNRLAETYMPFIATVAARLRNRFPRYVEREDLMNWGSIGLLLAVERFRPANYSKFNPFAARYAEGQMFQGLKSMNKQRSLAIARGESPPEVVSLDAKDGAGLANIAAKEPEVLQKSLPASVFEDLNGIERRLLVLQYEQDQPIAMCAEILGISDGHARKLSNELLERLRNSLPNPNQQKEKDMSANPNGNGRFHDGIEEMTPEEWTRRDRQSQRPAAVATPKCTALATAVKRLTCDERPGETFTIKEAAAEAKCKEERVYGSASRNNAVYGLHFRWISGHEPKNQKVKRRKIQPPRPATEATDKGEAALLYCRERPHQMTVEQAARLAGSTPLMVRRALTMKKPLNGFHFSREAINEAAPPSAPAAQLTARPRPVQGFGPAELAAVVSGLGAGAADRQSVEQLLTWAYKTREDWQKLNALIAGAATASISSNSVVVKAS